MGRKSKIEAHPQSEEIIRRLASGEEYSEIVRDFPGLKWDDLDYYQKKKLPVILSKSTELKEDISKSVELKAEAESIRGNDTLAEVRTLKARAIEILGQAQQAGDLKTALMGIREARSCLELCMKAEGQLNDAPQITIINNPEWVELRTLIITALEPYPDARQAVVNVIHK